MLSTVTPSVAALVPTEAVIFLAVLFVPVAAFVPAMALVTLVAAVALVDELHELGSDLGLFLDVLVHKVGHVVRPDVGELGDLDAAFHRGQDLCVLVDLPDAILDSDGLIRCCQVQLVQDDLVCKRNLLVRLVDLALLDLVVKPAQDVLRISHGHHGVQPEVLRELRIGHEGSHNGHWVRHPRGLDHDGINCASFLDVIEDLLEPIDEVAADGATHAPVVHDDDLLSHRHLVLFQQRVVNRDLSELVLDDCNLFVGLLLQNIVQQGRLAGAKEARQDCDRSLGLLGLLAMHAVLLHGHEVAVDAEGVAGDEVLAQLVVGVQRLLVVLHVPEHVDLELHGLPRLPTYILEDHFHLVH
mmetsp:Transcript_68721/g.194698  ORF Transcript_68721/g.194698 Transcript_68721/m.194698 type:complete len:356 (+) Transcript_68721:412-1479(+)